MTATSRSNRGADTFDRVIGALEFVASDLFVLGWTMLLTGILGAGLIRRQRAWIVFEGVAILGGYVGGLVILVQM